MRPALSMWRHPVGAAALAVALAAACAPALAGDDSIGWARENAARGRYDDAIKEYRKAIGGGGLEAKLGLGRLLLLTGSYKEAGESAASWAAAEPDSSPLQCLLGEARLEVGSYKEAAAAFEEAMRLDPASARARWGLIRALRVTGENARARELAGWFFDYYKKNEVTDAGALTCIGLACMDEDPKEAYRILDQATKSDPTLEDAYVAKGFLAIERYAFGLAGSALGSLLARNPNHPMAHLGMAQVLLASGKNEEAEKACAAALKVNPCLVPAMDLMATLLLIDENYDGTPEQLTKALEVNPNDLETLSMQAALAHVQGDAAQRDKLIARVLEINPSYSTVYIVVAKAAERKRDMPDAVAWGRRALQMAPNDWEGYFVVGMNLLRMGSEEEGYKLLEEAYNRNKFNVWARNTLVCLDKDFKRGEYVRHVTPHFVVKLHKSESAVLAPYVTAQLEAMYGDLTAKFGFAPSGTQEGGRILVSIFPNHADFSARTVGLPGLSALGACMGQLVTMPSPRVGVEQGAAGLFNWSRVLEHEFTHVVTLQMTSYRIPRWLTEGISVWQEADPQLKWDPLLKMAVEQNTLLPLERLNQGFTRPKYPAQVAISYYQAGLIVRYIAERHGVPAVVKMCRLYGEGRKTREVVEQVTGRKLEDVDRLVLDYIKAFVEEIRAPAPMSPEAAAALASRVSANPRDADSRAALAAALVMAGRSAEAKSLAEEALALNPGLARAHNVLGYLALKVDKKEDEAEKRFRTASEADAKDYFSRFALGYILMKKKPDEASALIERSLELYPRNTSDDNLARQNPYHLLGGLYEDKGKREDAVRVYRKAVETDHTDYHSAGRLGKLLAAMGDDKGALAAFNRCFEINPFEPETHLSAADAAARLLDVDSAVREYGEALELDGRSYKAAMGLARAFKAKGLRDEAFKAGKTALELEPDSKEALGFLESLK